MLHVAYGVHLAIGALGHLLIKVRGQGKVERRVLSSRNRERIAQYGDCRGSSSTISKVNTLFHGLFDLDGKLNHHKFTTDVQQRLACCSLSELAEKRDYDHYNIFEKAVIYNSVELMSYLLSLISVDYRSAFVCIYLQEAFHMACLLGCVDIMKLLSERFPLLMRVKGRIRVRNPIGPGEHGLKPLVSCTDSQTEPPTSHLVLQWVQTHHDELAVYFASCNNQLYVVQYLVEQMLCEEAYDLETIKELFFISCSCGALSCIRYFTTLLPDGVNTRDSRGWAIIEAGLSHGVKYFNTLMECGLDINILNNLNGYGDLTALHVLYSNLTKKDRNCGKYKEVFATTKCLLRLGVDVNQETTEYSSNGSKVTALGLLLDHLNLIVDTETKVTYISVQTRIDLQKAFDEDMTKSAALILNSGFDLKKHGPHVLLNLFSNHKHFLRFNIANVHPQLKNGSYGLENTLAVTRMIFSQGVKVTYRRRDTTPLLAFLSGFLMPVSPFDALGDKTFGEAFKECLHTLLQNKVDPNIYPLSKRTQHVPPLIRLIDLFITQWTDHAAMVAKFDDACLETICDIITLLADAGANFACYVNLGGFEYLTHGVFDNLFCTIIHNSPTRTSIYVSRSIDLVAKLSTLLIDKGAVPKLCEYAAYTMTGMVLVGSGTKLSLLYHWIYAGVFLNDAATGNVLENPNYHRLLEFLLNLADHEVYYSVLNEGLTSILEGHNNQSDLEHPTSRSFIDRLREMGTTVQSLKHICRIAVNQHLQSDYSSESLPLPKELNCYISDFALS